MVVCIFIQYLYSDTLMQIFILVIANAQLCFDLNHSIIHLSLYLRLLPCYILDLHLIVKIFVISKKIFFFQD